MSERARYDAVAAAAERGVTVPPLEEVRQTYTPPAPEPRVVEEVDSWTDYGGEAPRGGPEQRIERPAHYRSRDDSGIECLHAIRSMLGPEQYRGFLRGQVLKYTWRVERKKDSASWVKDLQKLRYYAEELEREYG